MKDSLPVLVRGDIAVRIAEGALLIIYRLQVINATSWAPLHPGGPLALQHFVGRDATDEIEAYHSLAALQRIERFAIGRVEVDKEGGWRPLTPPIALGLVRHPDGVKGHWAREGTVSLGEAILQRGISIDPEAAPIPLTPHTPPSKTANIIKLTPEQLEPASSNLDRRKEQIRSEAYQELKQRIVEAKLYERPGPLAGYGADLVRYTLLGSAAFSLFFLYVLPILLGSADRGSTNGWIGQMGSAVFLGLLFHQLTCKIPQTNKPDLLSSGA